MAKDYEKMYKELTMAIDDLFAYELQTYKELQEPDLPDHIDDQLEVKLYRNAVHLVGLVFGACASLNAIKFRIKDIEKKQE